MNVEKDLEAALQAPLSSDQRSALDARLRAAIAAAPAPRRAGLRVRRSLALAAVLLVVPIVGAGAAILATESPQGLSSAGEFAVELEAAKADVPLPAGRGWPDLASLTVDPDASYSRGGGRSTVEGVAVCIWLDDWLAARASGDAGREDSAADTVAAIPTWGSWTSPFWTESYTDHLQVLIDAVAEGDEEPVRFHIRTNCDWLEE